MSQRFPWLKAAAAAAALGVLGAVAATVALKTLFPEPKLRAMVVDAARRQLGREIKLERIDLGLSGLRLSGLEVSERPDFSAGTFLRVESFRLRPSWRAALRRRLVVQALSADGLKLRVVKSASGAYNFETLASSAPAAGPAAKPGESLAADFRVRHIRIAHGEMIYEDAGKKESWTASEVALKGSDLGLADPFDLELSLRLKGKAGERPVNAGIAFAGTVHPARGEAKLVKADIRRFSVEQDGAKLALSGKVARLDAPEADFKAELSLAGKTVLAADGTAKIGDAFEADLKARTPGLDTTLIAKLLPSAGIPALSIPEARAELKLRRAGPEAELSRLLLTWEGGKIEGKVAAKGLGTAKPAFDGAASFGLDIPEIRPGQYPFLKLPPKAFVPATRLDGELAFAGDELTLKGVKAKLKEGTVVVSGAVRRLGSAKPVPDLTAKIDFSLPAFKVSELPVAVASLPPGFVVPASRLGGEVRVIGEDARLAGLSASFAGGSIVLDGVVAKALAGTPRPEVDAKAELSLPALTDADLPFPGVPAGLRLPASRWEAELSYSPERARLKRLKAVLGANELALEGSISDPLGRGSFDLLAKCRRFVLAELAGLTPKTRELKPSGEGFFALSVTGTKEKPVFAGKLQFKDIAATVAGLPLSEFAGTVSFDEKRVDVPNLKGKLADGNLRMDLTVKDFARSPEIQLEAELDRFDLGRFLEAKKTVQAERAAAKAAAPGEPPAPAPALSTRGTFAIGALVHPSATVEKVKLSWDLRGLTPDLGRVDGDARLESGGGRVRGLKAIVAQFPAAKVFLLPLLTLQRITFRGLPDFNDFQLHRVYGDYLFKDGVMTVRESRVESEAANVGTTGTVELAKEALDLVMNAQVARFAPIDVAVTGTLSEPKTSLKIGKFIGDLLRPR